MKHVPLEKYSIAWFKLSECVARGEKERALGVYKLLSHSIDDAAFAAQLEGDLFLAFEDDAAVEKYCIAAKRYKKKQRFVEAAAVYEHLVALQSDVEDHVLNLILLYQILNFSEKFEYHLKKITEKLSNDENPTRLNAFLVKLQEVGPEAYNLAKKFISGK